MTPLATSRFSATRRAVIALAAAAALATLAGCGKEPEPGTVIDEAQQAGRDVASFPAADEDYFADMDGGYKHTVKGCWYEAEAMRSVSMGS